MAITKGYQALLAEARPRVRSIPAAEAVARLGREDTVFVDLRDPRELEKVGVVPGAVSAPRGMLEFWVDPASPYYRPVFGDDTKTYVLFCALGWRSTLACDALQNMGMTNVCEIDGGLDAFQKAGGPVVPKAEKKTEKKPA